MVGPERRHVTVVGVAADTSLGYSGQPANAMFYRPIRQDEYANGFSLLVRTRGSEAAAIAAVRDAAHALAPAMPIASLSTMKEKLELPMWPRRTAAGFFVICGCLALLLATVGLFGVTYFTVRQRTREFGIRIALGARSTVVIGQVLKKVYGWLCRRPSQDSSWLTLPAGWCRGASSESLRPMPSASRQPARSKSPSPCWPARGLRGAPRMRIPSSLSGRTSESLLA